MNSLFIHLSGQLSAEMGSELYLKIKDLSQNPTLICLDCKNLDTMDEVGVEYLKKIASRSKETRTHIAISGLQPAQLDTFSVYQIQNLFPSFTTSDEARFYLESLTPVETSTEADLKNKIETEVTRFILCPSCEQRLNIKAVGDYLCPNCKHKFTVNRRGWASVYERLV